MPNHSLCDSFKSDNYDPAFGIRPDDPTDLGDPKCIADTISLLCEPKQVFEVRSLGGTNARGSKSPIAVGYFDCVDELIPQLSRVGTPFGIYVTLNPPNPALLSRTNNAFDLSGQTNATRDNDIVSRRWLLVDLDPNRPSGISSTDEEHSAAFVRANHVSDWLTAEFGWPAPVLADSGNGFHLLYRVDLPNNAESTTLINSCLAAIDEHHSDEIVKIDRCVGNAGRIVRLYGTTTRKGAATCDRPYRISYIVEAPDQMTVVTNDQLHALTAAFPAPVAPDSNANNDGVRPKRPSRSIKGRFDVAAFIARHNIDATEPSEWQGGQRWLLRTCPMCSHGSDGPFIVQLPNGAISAGCQHQSCSWKWRELREYYEPHSARGFALTDMGNAERFVARYGHEVRYVATWKKWLVWEGTRWAIDDTLEVDRLAKATARSIREEAKALFTSEIQEGRVRGEQVWAWAIESEKRARLSAMLDLARSQAEVAISHEQLDTNPYLLNCANGTVELRYGQLLPHDRAHLITKTTAVTFPTAADAEKPYYELCPTWVNFLDIVFRSNQELIQFVQRLLGQALIGKVHEHVLPIFYGTGANGKGTLVRAVSIAVGDYFYAAPHRFLAIRKGESHPTELADLHGRRLVSASETEDGMRLDEALVKWLTGNDRITARRMREDHWSFSPSHTIVVSTNYRPVVTGTDHGIWRRLLLVPFEQLFVEPDESAQNPGRPLKDKSIDTRLAAESEGILRWLVDGAILYQLDGGLKPPAVVLTATAQYREDSDLICQWLAERCITDIAGARDRAGDLYENYVAWAKATGCRPVTQKRWGERLTSLGYERTRSNGIWYEGLRRRMVA